MAHSDPTYPDPLADDEWDAPDRGLYAAIAIILIVVFVAGFICGSVML